MSDFSEPNHGYNPHVARNQSATWGHDVFDRPDWHGRAACGRNGVLGDDPVQRMKVMFPSRGGKDWSVGLRACQVCPTTKECAEANQNVDLSHGREVGIWFGTTGRMRRLA